MSRRRAPTTNRTSAQRAEPPGHASGQRGRLATLVVLVVFAIVFSALEVTSFRQTSATWDEPGNLAAGVAALTAHDYRPAIEHPPLIRLWAALPFALTTAPVNTAPLDTTPPLAVAFPGPFELGKRFLYDEHDAEAWLYPARLQIVLIGIGLGVLVFCWTTEWLGFRSGVAALVLYTLEPNIAAHAALVTTDLGVTCFMFGSIYFLWRWAKTHTVANLAGVVLCVAAALLSKFSALLLLPMMLVLLTLLVWKRPTVTARSTAQLVVITALVTWIGVWAAYGFRYEPSDTAGWVFDLHRYPPITSAIPTLASLVGWIDAHHLLPNAFSEGFLHGQGLVQSRPAFLAGSFSSQGWWYYFPIAILLKTPIGLLALVLLGLRQAIRRQSLTSVSTEYFVLIPVVVFLGIAMTAKLNVGLRHVLPIYPFLIMLGAAGAHALFEYWQRPAAKAALTTLVLAIVLEVGRAYPSNLAFFNAFAGGPQEGYQMLADSNVDWGQDLKGVKAWMEANDVNRINLAYFGTADPDYYDIAYTPIWGTTIPGLPPTAIGPPTLPGYIAISVTLLEGVPFSPEQRDFYKPLRDRTPEAVIGGSIRIYKVDAPFW